MTHQVDAAAAWIYRGVWASVVGFFKVPEEPSTLPAAGEPVRSLRPSPGYLRYLKFLFWVALIPGDILPVVGWIAVSIAVPVLGVVLALPFLALMFLPDIFAYVGIHLRYDTTWYMLTDRSLRIRRGIMTIHETTISFENVQNVEVRAGSAAALLRHRRRPGDDRRRRRRQPRQGRQTSSLGAHIGLLQGLDDAEAVRNQILASVERTRSAGLGDEHPMHLRPAAASGSGLSERHLGVLREIRDSVRRLAPS